MLISLSGLCLGQVMLPDGHPDVVSGGLNTRGGGQHVSRGQEDSATHVATSAGHRHQPGKLTRPRGSEELSMGKNIKYMTHLTGQTGVLNLVGGQIQN